jgi:hypothetical protein
LEQAEVHKVLEVDLILEHFQSAAVALAVLV